MLGIKVVKAQFTKVITFSLSRKKQEVKNSLELVPDVLVGRMKKVIKSNVRGTLVCTDVLDTDCH